MVALNEDSINRIKKNTKEGEYGIGNPITKSNIYFREDGFCIIEVSVGEKIGLAVDGTNPLSGVVTGECLDPVTGVPFPDKSTSVFARKI